MDKVQHEIDELMRKHDARYETWTSTHRTGTENEWAAGYYMTFGAILFGIACMAQKIGITENPMYVMLMVPAALLYPCIPDIFAKAESLYYRGTPSKEWKKFYDQIREELQDIRGKRTPIVLMDDVRQYFRPKVTLIADKNGYAFADVIITPLEDIEFMTSIYGQERPASKKYLAFSVPIREEADIEKWKKFSAFDKIELPYIRIQLFPNIVGDQWSYLVPYNIPSEEIRGAFEKVCRMILYDIVKEKLKNGLKEPITEDGYITAEDLTPYFDRKSANAHTELTEIQKAAEKIEDLIAIEEEQHIPGINADHESPPATTVARECLEYGANIVDINQEQADNATDIEEPI